MYLLCIVHQAMLPIYIKVNPLDTPSHPSNGVWLFPIAFHLSTIYILSTTL